MNWAPFVSVILPCRNEAAFIDRCLDSILAADYPGPFEVIAADGMSTDGTRRLLDLRADLDPRLRVIENPERITPVALNRAIAASRGEIVVRFDAHAAMPPDYLRRSVELLTTSAADNVGGVIRTLPQSSGPFSGPIVLALGSRFGVGDSQFRTHSGASGPRPADTVFGGAWKRELFTRIGGFNEKLARGQDMEFNLRLRRAGGTILLDPAIVCDYCARADLASFLTHNFSNGVWAVLPFGLSEIVPVRARHLIPLVFVTALAASLALPFPWSIAVPAAYAAANLAFSASIALAHRRWTSLALLPVAFACLHLAYGLGSAWGCVQLARLKIAPLERNPKYASHPDA
jgi:glycosyltransferase involved in cell wall biosynthesis